MTHTHTYTVIDQTTRDTVKDSLVRVTRRTSETDAYPLPLGHYKVMTSNGESVCEAPVWILWDTSGYPYPITPDEFETLYDRTSSVDQQRMTLRDLINAEIAAERRRRWDAANAGSGTPLDRQNRLRLVSQDEIIDIALRIAATPPPRDPTRLTN